MANDERARPLVWAPEASPHILDTDEVLVLSETGRAAFRGRAYVQVARLIDGRRTTDDIVDVLSDEANTWVVDYALARLRGRDVVRYAEVEAEDAPPAVEVLTAGIPEAAAETLAARLRGEAHGSGPALTVVLVDDYLRTDLDALVRERVAAGRRVLPVRPAGRRVWIGPLIAPGSEATWDLCLRRMRMNRAPDVFALAHGSSLPLVPTDTTPEGLELGLALAASIGGSILLGRDPAELGSSLRTLDREDLSVQWHPVAHATSERLPPPPAFGAPLVDPPVLRSSPRDPAVAGGRRTVTPDETFARLRPLISRITGAMSDPQPAEAGTASHVYRAKYVRPWVVETDIGRLQAGESGSAGKDGSAAQARAGCAAEAIEWHSSSFFGDEPRRRARLAEIEEIAIDPRRLMLFSQQQYDDGPGGTGRTWVPAPFDPTIPIEWTPCVSLVDGATRWVPSGHLFVGYRDLETGGERAQLADSNGCAAGNSLEEATLQAVLELIERDAVGLWWYSRARRPEIDIASFGDPHLERIAEASDASGWELHLLDLTTDVGISCMAAVRWRREDGGHIEMGHASGLDPRITAARALGELEQWASYDPPYAVAGTWFGRETIGDHPYLVPSGGERLRAADLPHTERADLREDIDTCVGRLAALGHDVLLYDHTRPEVRFPVVRAMAPGLRHAVPRLAPGRLYDVPVALGWVPARLDEDQLNPIAFPL